MNFEVERISSFNNDLIADLRSVFTDKNWSLVSSLSFVKDNKNYFLLVKKEGEMAGFLIAYRLQRLDEKSSKVLIYEVEVAKPFRKMGLASKMIETILSMAKKDGAVEVWVPTNKSNLPAVALYQKTGATGQDSDDIIFKYVF
ncbi:MAG: GNAT family N-acetyltransferase [Patescibacteria group bacterium]